MKKNLLGLFAIILAVAFSAFTLPKNTTSYVFQYDNTSFLVENIVENELHWDFVSTDPGDLFGGCNGDDKKACRILVSGTHVDGSNILQSSAQIETTLTTGLSPNTRYVDITISGTQVLFEENKE